ncbi:MAG: hypothetical protein ABW208_16435 [Pyrinomonadaceae bacterium]
MNHTKCPRCGLVNWLTPEVCERCGLPLGGGDTEARPHEPARPVFPLNTFGSDVMAGTPPGEPQEPAVRKWYLVFCVGMAITCLPLVLLGFSFLLNGQRDRGMSEQEAQVMGLIFIGLGVVLLTLYAAAPFLPRRRWAWIMGIVLIVFSMSSTCCLPAAIPLLVFWVKLDNKVFYGVGVEGRNGE